MARISLGVWKALGFYLTPLRRRGSIVCHWLFLFIDDAAPMDRSNVARARPLDAQTRAPYDEP
ncbi:MAG TPA: hypothetical protein VGY53_12325, partial [Isosphaeraceae bacterium]|nr:hypothetical protein [Isosphaeraceae bacterium]